MKVYLMRHGIALDVADGGDAARPLSPEGRRKTADVARGLERLGVKAAVCVSSPLSRARETAEIVARALKAETDVCEALAPGGDVNEFLEWLDEHDAGDVLAVGHMPDLGRALAVLVGGGDLRVQFKKSGVACIEFESRPRREAGCLGWLLTPRIIRKIR